MYRKLKAIATATLYPLLYFACQLVVQLAFLVGVKYSLGSNISSYTAADVLGQKIYFLTLLSAALCFVIILIVSKKAKSNIFQGYKKISMLQICLYILLAAGLYILIALMNVLLINFFPEYNTQIMEFFKPDQTFIGILAIGIVAPLIEELIFRGGVYDELKKIFPTWVVILLQAFLFGAVHSINLQRIQTFVLGLVFGYIRTKTDNIWAPTIMHITNNVIACILVFVLL